jgi:hypothetical protein
MRQTCKFHVGLVFNVTRHLPRTAGSRFLNHSLFTSLKAKSSGMTVCKSLQPNLTRICDIAMRYMGDLLLPHSLKQAFRLPQLDVLLHPNTVAIFKGNPDLIILLLPLRNS